MSNEIYRTNTIPVKKLVFDIKKGSFLRTYYINYNKYKKFIEKLKSEKNKIKLNVSNNEMFDYYKKFSNKYFLASNIKLYLNDNENSILTNKQREDIKQIVPDNINKDNFELIFNSMNLKEKESLSKTNLMNKIFSNTVLYVITGDSFYLNNNHKSIKNILVNNFFDEVNCSNFNDLLNFIQITTKQLKKSENSNVSLDNNLFDVVMDIETRYKSKFFPRENNTNVYEIKVKINKDKIDTNNKLINNIISKKFSYFGISHGKIINYLNPHEIKLKEIFKNLIGNSVDYHDKIFISNIPFNINIILKFKEKLPLIIDNLFFFVDGNLKDVVNFVLLDEKFQYKHNIYLYTTLFNNLNVINKLDKNFFNNLLSYIKNDIFITDSKRDLIYFIYNLFENKIDKKDLKEYVYSSLYNSYFSDLNISYTYYQNNIDYFRYLIYVENDDELFYNYILSQLFLSHLNIKDITSLVIDLFSKLNINSYNENTYFNNKYSFTIININELLNILSNTTNRIINKEFISSIKNILFILFNSFLPSLRKDIISEIFFDFQVERKILPIHFLLMEILYTYFTGKRSGFIFYDKIYKSLGSFHFPYLLNLIDNNFYTSFNKSIGIKFDKNNMKKFQGKIYVPIKSLYVKSDILFIKNSLNKIYNKTISKRIYPIFIGYLDINDIKEEEIDFIELEIKEEDNVYLIDNSTTKCIFLSL